MKGKDSIIINSKKDKVWQAILEGKNYFKWNSVINAIEGNIREGNRVKLICLCIDGGKVTYDAVVERLKEEEELRLRITNKLNNFIYYIKINEIAENQVEVVQGKEFMGLCTLIKKSYMNKEIKKLKIMNKELRGYILMSE